MKHATSAAIPYDGLPDGELARLIAAGDLDALRFLMRCHNRVLFRTARSVLGDDAEAEDAVQEAYLSAYRSIAAFRAEARLSTWLVRITLNEALKRRARAHRATVVPLHADAELEIDTEPAAEARMPERPDQSAARAELRRLLEARIDALPDAFRVVFVLRAVEEMSFDEIAACLQVPAPTVRTRYFRARALLREALEQQFDAAVSAAFGFDGARCDRLVECVLARVTAPGPEAP